MVRSIEGKHPNYFEAVLQLRDVTKEVVEYVEDEFVRTKLIVAKKIKLKNGFDYFLADNEQTRALGKRLQQKFGGEIKTTSSLQTKKDNKELYRVTVLFRLPPFAKNDFVEYQGEEWNISILGKEIHLQNSKTGKKSRVKYKDMKSVKKK
jgi:NMD protein affecting ribosome stability and mRNA decay